MSPPSGRDGRSVGSRLSLIEFSLSSCVLLGCALHGQETNTDMASAAPHLECKVGIVLASELVCQAAS